MIEQTFCIVKPDVVGKFQGFHLLADIEDLDFTVIDLLKAKWSILQARAFYAEHEGKDFFERQIEFMSSGPLIMAILEGEDAVLRFRRAIGATDPLKAEFGTLRGMYGSVLPQNAVHGSDSPESAAREIGLFKSWYRLA